MFQLLIESKSMQDVRHTESALRRSTLPGMRKFPYIPFSSLAKPNNVDGFIIVFWLSIKSISDSCCVMPSVKSFGGRPAESKVVKAQPG